MDRNTDEIKNKVKNISIEVIFTILYILILYFCTMLAKEGTKGVQLSLINFVQILYNNKKYILIPIIILFATFFILKAIFRNNLKSYVALTIITLIITLISYYKYNILYEPLIPTDILLIGNAGEIAGFGLTWPPLIIWIITITLVLILLLYTKTRKKENKEKHKITIKTDLYRIPLFLVGAFIIYYMCIAPERYENLGIRNVAADNYRAMGANAEFFLSLRRLLHSKTRGL